MGDGAGQFLAALDEYLEGEGFRRIVRFSPDANAVSEGSMQLAWRRLQNFQQFRLTSWLVSLVRGGFDWTRFFYGISGLRSGCTVVVSGLLSRGQALILSALCRVLSARAVMVFHGTDVRPLYLNGKSLEAFRRLGPQRFARKVRKQSRAVETACRGAWLVITWQGASHFTTVPVYLFEKVSFPMTREGQARGTPGTKQQEGADSPIKVFHAPSEAPAKGTSLVKDVIATLQSDGFPITLQTLSGVSNKEVLRALENCDVVVDQAFSDNPLGLLAREAGVRKKAVVVAGESLDRIVLEAHQPPPIVVTKPAELEKTLRLILKNRERLRVLGNELHDYMSAKDFGAWFIGALRPSQQDNRTSVDAAQVFRDFHPGFGGYAPKKELAAMIRGLYEHGGFESFCLSNHPAFIQEMLIFYEVKID